MRSGKRRRLPACTGDEARSAHADMTRVAIIGGGIGGLTAANALSQAGIEVAVYEAAGELKEIGAGVALHANAMRVLRAIGAEDGVRKVAGRSEWAVTRNGKTVHKQSLRVTQKSPADEAGYHILRIAQ